MKWGLVLGLSLAIVLIIGGTVAYVMYMSPAAAPEAPIEQPQRTESPAMEDEFGSSGGADGVFCTQQYDPVCGVDGKTYGNRCVAEEQAGVEVAAEGECQAASSETDSAIESEFSLGADTEAVVCSEELEPVCGEDGQTYANRCVAEEQAGVEVAHEGAC